MIIASAVASIAVFAFALWLSDVIRVSTGVIATAQSAVAVMRDEKLDDLKREKAIQQASMRLFADFASILFRGALAVVASLLPIWLVDATGLATARAVFEFLSRWDVIIVTTVVMIFAYFLRTRLWPSN